MEVARLGYVVCPTYLPRRSPGPFTVNAARKAGADVAPGDTTYDPKTTTHLTVYDVSKSGKIFGFKYRTMDETTRDILADFKGRGWVKA